jgi:hypothetical protein
MIRAVTLSVCLSLSAAPALADVVRIQDLNTTQIRALDRAKTIVILPGGMREEHGPWLVEHKRR